MSNPIPALVEKLSDPDPETRLLTIKRLGMMYDPQVIPALLKMLVDPEAKIREAVILSIGALGEAETIIGPIINCLEDETSSVQLAAIKVLGEMRSIRATKPLVKMLTEKDPKVRTSCVIALGQIDDKNALFPLIDTLQDKDITVRIHTILALGQIGDLRAVEPIIELLKDEPAVQQVAALTLGKFSDARIIGPLKDLLSSSESKTRQCAIVSLGSLKNPEIIEPMLKLLNDQDPSVRRAAATALSEIKDKTTTDHFIIRLKDSNLDIQITSARALGKLKDSVAIPALVDALKDKSPEVREEVANALGELKSTDAVAPLIKGLWDKIATVRASCATALGKIEGNSPEEQNFSDRMRKSMSIVPLNKTLKDPELLVRAKAAEALAKIQVNQHNFRKAREFYTTASKESLTWDYHQEFYAACANGCKVLGNIKGGLFNENRKPFAEIKEALKSAAKMIGNKGFLSENLWKTIEIFNNIFLSNSKDQFIQCFKDLGLEFVILQKKLPEDIRNLLDIPQEGLNAKFQVIQKRGLGLSEAVQELDLLKTDLFEAANRILQIEPLEVVAEGDSEKTIDVIENLMAFPGMRSEDQLDILSSGPMSGLSFRTPQAMSYTKEKKFALDEVEIGSDQNLGDVMQISLIQMLKGVRRLSLVEDPRELWDRNIKRYYDFSIFKNQGVLQFTPESVQLRAKPKIIGFMDDCIFEGSSLIIFPECSVPYDYLDKLKQFADRYNIFIIAGIEAINDKNVFYNRAYVIAPYEEEIPYQQKNSPTVLNSSEKAIMEWKENIQTTSPPLFEVFYSPFGKFIIVFGQDMQLYGQYIPFIMKEKGIDLVIILNNGFEDQVGLNKIQTLADEIKKPVLYVNTGQFGGTAAYLPNKENFIGDNDLRREFTEGIVQWTMPVIKRAASKNEAVAEEEPTSEPKAAAPVDLLQEKLNKIQSEVKSKNELIPTKPSKTTAPDKNAKPPATKASSSERSVVKPIEKPAAKPAEKPAEKPVAKAPVKSDKDKKTGKSDDKNADKSVEELVEQLAKQMADENPPKK